MRYVICPRHDDRVILLHSGMAGKRHPLGKDELMHYGTKGMSWGNRRYQNKDGSLTPEGYRHYGIDPNYFKNGGRQTSPLPKEANAGIAAAKRRAQQAVNAVNARLASQRRAEAAKKPAENQNGSAAPATTTASAPAPAQQQPSAEQKKWTFTPAQPRTQPPAQKQEEPRVAAPQQTVGSGVHVTGNKPQAVLNKLGAAGAALTGPDGKTIQMTRPENFKVSSLYNDNGTKKNFFQQVGDWVNKNVAQPVASAANSVGNWVGNAANDVGKFVGDTANNVLNGAKEAAGNVGQFAIGVADPRAAQRLEDHANGAMGPNAELDPDIQRGLQVRQVLDNTGNGVANWVDNAANDVGKFVGDTANNIGNAATNAWNGVTNWVGNAANDVGKFVGDTANNVGNAVGNAATNAWNGVANWVGNAANDVGKFVGDTANNALNGAKEAAGNVGQFTRGVADPRATQRLEDYTNGAMGPNAMLDPDIQRGLQARQFLDNASNDVARAANSVGNWVGNVANDVGNAANNVWNGVTGAVNDAGKWIGDTAGNVWNGVTGAANSAGQWVGNAANDTRQFIGGVADPRAAQRLEDHANGAMGPNAELDPDIQRGLQVRQVLDNAGNSVARAANTVNANVIQPAVKAVQPAVNWVNQNVVQPVAGVFGAAGSRTNQNVIQPTTNAVQGMFDDAQTARELSSMRQALINSPAVIGKQLGPNYIDPNYINSLSEDQLRALYSLIVQKQ